MKMSHIYQPAMIHLLLSKDGQATDKEIAAPLLRYDPSQVEYYENIVKKMVGRVLANHNIVSRSKGKFELLGFGLTSSRILDRAKVEISGFCEGLKSLYEGMYFLRLLGHVPLLQNT